MSFLYSLSPKLVDIAVLVSIKLHCVKCDARCLEIRTGTNHFVHGCVLLNVDLIRIYFV